MSDRPIILCSQNPGKVREFLTLLGDVNLQPLSSEIIVPEETGATLEANARIKAEHGHSLYPGHWVIADDSGLEVDALDGAPGVYSARYAGEHGDNDANNELLLANLAGYPHSFQRTARFACVLMAISPDGREFISRGTVEGHIGLALSGSEGFGYDPLFIPEGYTETFAELPDFIKHSMSHRGRACAALMDLIGSEIL